MEVIFIIWVLIFIWCLLSLLGILKNEHPTWVVSMEVSWMTFLVYSGIASIIAIIKLAWAHLPGG